MSDFRSTRESNTSEHSLANPMQYHYSFTGGYRSTLALFLGTLYMLLASWRSNNVARRIPCNSSSKSRDQRTKVTSHKAEIGTKWFQLESGSWICWYHNRFPTEKFPNGNPTKRFEWIREVPWYEPATALAVSKPRGDDKCRHMRMCDACARARGSPSIS